MSEPEASAPWRRLTGIGLGIGLFATLLAVPPPEGVPDAAWRVVAALALMAIWWVTEAIPIAATALLPLVLFPLLDVASIEAASTPYANPLVFLLLGGFLIGLGMQRCNLHRRLALAILRMAGTRPESLIGGFMLATAVLSMWISNTATAAMMLPIGLSVLKLFGDRSEITPEPAGGTENLPLALLLGIAFAANIGGMGTLIGTPPNAVLAGYVADAYQWNISFARWMLVGVPVATVLLGIAWLVLSRVMFPVHAIDLSGVGRLLAEERRRLGPITTAEKRFLAVFAVVVLAWLLRPALSTLVPDITLTDAGIAVAGALASFSCLQTLRAASSCSTGRSPRTSPGMCCC